MNFNFGYTETDKPIPILSRTLQSESSLRASASQMLQLIRILPFLIGDKIPEDNENWLCFLLLRKIVDIVLSPILNEDICISLKRFIEEHHKKFIVLYGSEAFIPKLHFMLHYPEQITAVGPMVRTWTIRHEAKLNFFKQASHLLNFKNVSYALANRHQRWICHELACGKLISNFLECGPSASGVGVTKVGDKPREIQERLFTIEPHLNQYFILGGCVVMELFTSVTIHSLLPSLMGWTLHLVI